MDCCICLDVTDKKNRTPTQCSFCMCIVCRTCIQTYLLQESDAVCPNTECKKHWSSTFLCETLTNSFRLGPYKEHREKVLFDREKARLPDTQDDAKRYKDALTVYTPLREEVLRLNKAHAESAEYKTKVKLSNPDLPERNMMFYAGDDPSAAYKAFSAEWDAMIKAYYAYKKPIDARIKALNKQIAPLRFAINSHGTERGAVEVKERRKFVMKCPQSTCEGFLSQQYKCGLCDAHVCAQCHILKTDGHVCDVALVETIKQIRKEARPCPKCASLISKIDGCDQMWCTQCNTAFSWNTGTIQTGVVHNPHYFQYMRERGEGVPRADNPGFACAEINNLGSTLTRLSATLPAALPLVEAFRMLAHVRANDLMSRRHTLTQYQEQEWRRILRVQRLVGEIDQTNWMLTLQRREKAFHKDTAWVHLLEMHTTVSLETMAEITAASDVPTVELISARLAAIKEYTLTEATKISKMYGCVIPYGIRPK